MPSLEYFNCTPNSAGTDFDRLLAEAVDESLSDLLGETVRKAIYLHFERQYSLPRNQIPNRLDDFCNALQNTFGSSTPTVGKTIAKRLYAKLGLEFVEKVKYGFADYVREAGTRLQV